MQIIIKFYKLLNVYIYFILFSLLIVFFSTTYSNANAFKVSDIEISSPFELNFEKNNVIDKGFQTSFSDLISMITTSGDRKKIKNNVTSTTINMIQAGEGQDAFDAFVVALQGAGPLAKELNDHIGGTNINDFVKTITEGGNVTALFSKEMKKNTEHLYSNVNCFHSL